MAPATRRIRRHGRVARWLHATVYLATLPLLLSGWWLIAGEEGRPSPLARAVGISDARLHVRLGWALAAIVVAGIVIGWRAIPTLVRESLRHDAGDAGWFLRWPRGVLTGRFARHEGTFDPGQRVANLVIVMGLLVLVVTGTWLSLLHGGRVFAVLAKIHLWTAIVLTPVLLGHVLIAAGVLPGYRGVWRAMHLGGRVPEETAHRIWPGWTERLAGSSLEPPPELHDRVERALAEEWAARDRDA